MRPDAEHRCSALDARIVALLRRRLLMRHAMDATPADRLRLLRAVESWQRRSNRAGRSGSRTASQVPSGLDLIVEVAHDLRSPLTSILFLAETMLHGRSGPLTPLQERQLGLVYSAAFGLNAVASDVIELVRGGDRLVGS